MKNKDNHKTQHNTEQNIKVVGWSLIQRHFVQQSNKNIKEVRSVTL